MRMWLTLKSDYYRTRRYIIFGRKSRFFSDGRFPAVFYVPGRKKTSYNDFSVYSGDDIMYFIRGADAVEEAFSVGGVNGVKRALLSMDVYDVIGKLYGVSRRKIKNIIRTSNEMEFVPFFDLNSNYLYVITNSRRPQSVQVFRDITNDLVIRFYSGSNVYVYRNPRDRKKLFGSFLRGKIVEGYEEKKRCESFDGLLAEYGKWYLMRNRMVVMNNNVLVEAEKERTRVIYPVENEVSIEEAALFLDKGELVFDYL